jgi:hypothetical protein
MTKRSIRPLLHFVLSTVGVAAAVAACGGSGGTNGESSGDAAADATGDASEDSAAMEGGPDASPDASEASSSGNDASGSDGGAEGGEVGDGGLDGAAMDASATDGGGDASVDAHDAGPVVPPILATDGTVSATLHVGTGVFIGGTFTRVSTYPVAGLVPLGPTGAPASCPIGVGFDGEVYAVLYAGGSIYAGGTFTHYQGQSANHLAKIDPATCALDTTFSPPAKNGTDNNVLALGSDGTSLYVGGSFLNYAGATAYRLAKVDLATGALDTTFDPPSGNGFDNNVNAIAIAGSSIYLGGSFNTYRGVAGSAAHLAKLDLATGAQDTTFSPPGANGFSDSVLSLAASATSLYVGGYFTAYQGVAGSATRLAKLDLVTGALDVVFDPPAANGCNDIVKAIVVSGSSVYVGGRFTSYRGVAGPNRIAKLDATTGVLDTTFSPANNGFDQQVNALAVQGGALFAGGTFSSYRGVGSSAKAFAKLDAATGAQDTSFVPPAGNTNGFSGASGGSSVDSIATDGTNVWPSGRFAVYGGYATKNLAKLDDAAFMVDTAFSPLSGNGFDGAVAALASNGTALYVGGAFSNYLQGSGASAHHIAKLDPSTGAIDTSFGAPSGGFDATVSALAVGGTSVYAGGSFSAYGGIAGSATALAKLDLVTGAQDTTFSPPGATANGFSGPVLGLATSATSVYAVGNFTAYRGVAGSANDVAKLDLATGALDTTFSPPASNGFDGAAACVAISGSSLYVGGTFSAYQGVPSSANDLAKLDLTTGAIDTTFSPTTSATANGFNAGVASLYASGTSLYVGGAFTAYQGVAGSSNRLAKLDLVSGVLDTTFSPAAANGFDQSVSALGGSASLLVVGGAFGAYEGTLLTRSLALLDPATGGLQ